MTETDRKIYNLQEQVEILERRVSNMAIGFGKLADALKDAMDALKDAMAAVEDTYNDDHRERSGIDDDV